MTCAMTAPATLPDFPLNRPDAPAPRPCGGSQLRRGSSREAAVYALVDFGIRASSRRASATSSRNAVNNGLLPARVSEADAAALLAALADGPRQAVST
jgi:3-isopropylmalate/(R)-2-methylmalate dehydratase small subunit